MPGAPSPAIFRGERSRFSTAAIFTSNAQPSRDHFLAASVCSGRPVLRRLRIPLVSVPGLSGTRQWRLRFELAEPQMPSRFIPSTCLYSDTALVTGYDCVLTTQNGPYRHSLPASAPNNGLLCFFNSTPPPPMGKAPRAPSRPPVPTSWWKKNLVVPSGARLNNF